MEKSVASSGSSTSRESRRHGASRPASSSRQSLINTESTTPAPEPGNGSGSNYPDPLRSASDMTPAARHGTRTSWDPVASRHLTIANNIVGVAAHNNNIPNHNPSSSGGGGQSQNSNHRDPGPDRRDSPAGHRGVAATARPETIQQPARPTNDTNQRQQVVQIVPQQPARPAPANRPNTRRIIKYDTVQPPPEPRR